MASEIYVFHPGVGQKKSGAAGPIVKTESGVDFVYIEQDFGASSTSIAYFHGAVVPPDLASVGNVIFRITLRQVSVGASQNVEFDVLYNTIRQPKPPAPYVPSPPDRDVPLTPNGALTIPIPGAPGLEVSEEFTLPVAGFTSGDELLLAVQRVIGGSDTFSGGIMALIRLDTVFPIQDPSPKYINLTPLYEAHGGLPLGWTFPSPGASMQEMFDAILYPFRAPTITSFSLTALSPIPGPVPSSFEVGNSIPPYTPPPPAPAPPNSIQFIWSTNDPDGHLTQPAVALSTDIDHLGVGNIVTNTSSVSPQTFPLNVLKDPVQVVAADMPSVPSSVPVSGQNRVQHTFRIQMDYQRQLTPPPAPPSTITISRNAVYSWYWRVFAGISLYTSLREIELTGVVWGAGGPFVVGMAVEDTATGLKTGVVSWVDGGDDKHIKVVMDSGSADFLASENLTDSATGTHVLNNITINSYPDDLIEALSNYNSLTGQVSRTYSFSAGGYKYLCYPDSFAWATGWTDTLTGFNVPFQNIGTVAVTNSYNETILYKVQRSSNIIGAAINIAVS